MKDNPLRYGTLTRFFHWLMALGFAWMLFTAISRFIDKESALTKAVFAYHPQIGFTLLLLGILRVLWALSQRSERPLGEGMARVGHFLLYALMIIVPVLALLRSFGSGRGFSYWGTVPVIAPSEDKIDALVQLGNNFHGLLGWTLFALIIGHILFAIKHRLAGGDEDVMPRIIGR